MRARFFGAETGIPAASVTNPLQGEASFRLSSRLYRGAFALAWLTLCRWTPPAWRRWRAVVLRVFGADIASTAKVYASVAIWSPANLTLGEFACLGPGSIIYSMAPITVERYAVVSQRAHLCAGGHDVDDPRFRLQAAPIRICERGWVAAEAYVGAGVTVGVGAVLGARACAAKDLEPWTVYVGNPARPVRRRRLRTGIAQLDPDSKGFEP